MEERNIYGVWLATRPGVSPSVKKQLLAKYESAKNLYFLNEDEINLINADETTKTALKYKNLDHAKHICEECVKKDIEILQYEDDFYPPLLREISNSPSLLYRKGKNIDYRSYPMASVVGSRLLSAYGKDVTEKISYDLAKLGFLVVSGMALGADAYAHINALKANAPTVAVLGCGVDVVYPYDNRELYDNICRYGAVLSEYPPETRPDRFNFPARNRIVSGMSHLTVVTEARLKSGSLITANDTYKQGKDVFAVPQNINSPYGQGTNQILKEYAKVITSASDAWNSYVRRFMEGNPVRELENAILNRREKKNTTVRAYKNLPELNEEEKKIINVLKNGITHINKISMETGYPLGKINAVASLLEIRGIIYSVSGNAYGIVSPEIWNSGETDLRNERNEN